MNWRTKAIGHQILSKLPGGNSLYYFLQKKFGGYRNFKVESKVSQSLRILEALNEVNISVEDKNTCEIGTRWVPIMLMVFYAFGQKSCYTFDVMRLLNPQLSENATRQISLLSRFFEERASWEWNVRMSERLHVLEENSQCIDELFIEMKIFYKAPVKVPYAELDENSIDIVFSNTTFEQIPPYGINELLVDAKRILTSNGVIAHLIDCSDHYNHSAPAISKLNFLQFSETECCKFNSKFLYQNRLRASNYHELIEKAGFEILL